VFSDEGAEGTFGAARSSPILPVGLDLHKRHSQRSCRAPQDGGPERIQCYLLRHSCDLGRFSSRRSDGLQ